MTSMRRLLLFCSLLTLPGCAELSQFLASAFQKPTLTFRNARLTEANLENVTLDTVWRINNPNAVGISLARADYRLSIEGKQVVAGHPPLGLTIPAAGSSELVFPASIKLADIFPAVEVLATKDRARYRVEGVVGVNTPLGIIDLPLSYEGEFEVPKIPKLEFQPPKVTGLTLSGATIEFPLVVTNRNSFALPLQGVSGTLSIAGSPVGTLSTGNLGQLQGNATQVVRLPLTIDLLRAAGAAQAAVRGGTAPVTFKAELVSGNSRVPVDINQVLQFIK